MGYGKRKMMDGEKKMKKTKTKMPNAGDGMKVGEDFGILDAKAKARSAFSGCN